MGWFTGLLENIDRPSNALQGLAVDGVEGLKSGWLQKKDYDFEQMWDEDLAKQGYYERDNLGRASYVASAALNLLVDPLNLLPVGLLKKGTQAVKNAKQMGANVDKSAMKGSFVSSFPNYIQGHYAPTDRTKEVMKALDEGLLSGVKIKGAPLSSHYKKAKKGTGFAKTGLAGLGNIVKNSLSPEARAVYRSHNINKGMMEGGFLSNKGNTDLELIHRALYNAHIAEQSGTVGSKTLLKDFMKRVEYQGYTPFKEGTYHKVSKGRVMGGQAITKDEANMLEDIMGRVWVDGKGIKASDDASTRVFIKRPSSPKGGQHVNDLKVGNSKDFNIVRKLFEDKKIKSPLKVKKTSSPASDIFGEGAERVRYIDTKSGGTIEVVSKKDGTASVLELSVPEDFRGQGIGKLLQRQVMEDFPNMGGQVSSKAAAKTAYDLGRRPPNNPNATLDDVFKMIDEQSSVNLIIKNYKPKTINDMNIDELAEYLTESTGKVFKPDEKTGQVWSNFSMTGSSITEGGVNVAFGIKPSGRFIASVSDEHNFLEKIKWVPKKGPLKGKDIFPVGKMVSSSLPNRIVMMTTPVTGKITKFKRAEGSGAKKTIYEKARVARDKEMKDEKWLTALGSITDAKATRPDLMYETGRQYQGLGAGSAGLFSLPDANE